MQDFNQQLNQLFSQPLVLLPLLLWSIFWKGLALWRAASKRQLIWFLILLVVNTIGLLEIVYVFYLHKWDPDRGKLLVFLEKKFSKTKGSV